MKVGFLKGTSKRTKIFTLISVVSITLLLALNFLLSYFSISGPLYLDMTPEGLYSLSAEMERECDRIVDKIEETDNGEKIKLTFCTDPDYILKSYAARYTYFMAMDLRARYSDRVEVETVNVVMNPTAVAQYKTTSLTEITANDLIVSYGERYRIVNLNSFWKQGTSGDFYYDGEYRVASLIRSVTAVEQPSAYFVTDHGETYYDPSEPTSDMSKSMGAFADLLRERGMQIKTLKLSDVAAIPEDCVLLIINNPTLDFTYDPDRLDDLSYVSETEKLDNYLVERQGAIMVAKDYRKTLPVFETFLHEWGFKFSTSVVTDDASCLVGEDKEKRPTDIIAQYDKNPESYGYALYGEYADLDSAAITVFSDTGSVECSFLNGTSAPEAGTSNVARKYAPYLTASKTAKRYMRDPVTGELTSILDGDEYAYHLAAVSVRTHYNTLTQETKQSYLFCVNSASFLSNGLVGEPSYANFDILSAAIEDISRIDDYASTNLGGVTGNSLSPGGKKLLNTSMSTEDVILKSNKHRDNDITKDFIVIKFNHGISGAEKVVYTIFVAAIPIAALVVGIVVSVKRRYL
ncbi:MAG: Gldg family protein [Clostridia bacterium]|nr:Gldg family protein [Clostridia bacterium]